MAKLKKVSELVLIPNYRIKKRKKLQICRKNGSKNKRKLKKEEANLELVNNCLPTIQLCSLMMLRQQTNMRQRKQWKNNKKRNRRITMILMAKKKLKIKEKGRWSKRLQMLLNDFV